MQLFKGKYIMVKMMSIHLPCSYDSEYEVKEHTNQKNSTQIPLLSRVNKRAYQTTNSRELLLLEDIYLFRHKA